MKQQKFYSIQGGKIELIQGDITQIPSDIIVNAANSELRPGAGVCGAIYKAAGFDRLVEETKKLGRVGEYDVVTDPKNKHFKNMQLVGGKVPVKICSTGKAVHTLACDLPAKYIFHAVGPVYESGFDGEDILLRSAYDSCYALLVKLNLENTMDASKICMSISFPAISTGVYNYPIEEATKIAVASAIEFTKHVVDTRKRVDDPAFTTKFVCFSEEDFKVYEKILDFETAETGPGAYGN